MADVYQQLQNEIDAALLESASFAWRISPSTCFRNPETGASCVYYHRIWQYLLALGATSSMRTDTKFLIDNTRQALRANSNARVLVCGAADYGLLAHVLWSARLESATPSIVVVDRCKTSLELNQWYANRVSQEITIVESDILDASEIGEFDVVCTHSFLGWFSPAERARLIEVWRRALKPQGIVITTKRLRAIPAGEIYQKFDEKEAVAFSERVRSLASAKPVVTGDVDPSALALAALEYARGHQRYPMQNEEELVSLFGDGGLEIVALDDGSPWQGQDRPSGPRKGMGQRLRIVARRCA